MKMNQERRGKGMLFLFLGGGGGMTRVKSLLGGAFFFLYIFLAVDAPLFPTQGS